ncbi:PEP/pyruvate-binding domain-containing protein [Maridesulfovibrio ferrireducens]|uniref:PEP/pyruvate-binding domain-containing protein n=1 Tax=Maridesulfovibrio ferrireducens TaxID=246191 RepID=UPI001A1E38CB|nr:PEP/pyruvate-binding domain-containing protein [Maridesulfovibrio ferrireducens]MBI9111333.1 phosphoenolpyruvate synthase [Maridesulfovibrio ferrireducens]
MAGKTEETGTAKKVETETPKKSQAVKQLEQKMVLAGSDIVKIGEDAELLVGGKNYNTALISQVDGIRSPQFRAISSLAFHQLLDETKVHASVVRAVVDSQYNAVDWNSESVNSDSEFIQNFVRSIAFVIKEEAQKHSETLIQLRTFINNVVEGFATSPEGIDQLRKRSVLVQSAILSVELPKEVDEAVKFAYLSICKDAGLENEPVAVRSSAAGEDSRKKAFAGLQDTYLNIVGEDNCSEAYHWDCASAYNLRSMTYRREAILDAVTLAENTGDASIAEIAKKEWAIENTSLSVCIMRMINPVISGTAFSADTATGCRGTDRKDLVSIDASYGLGEAVVGGMVTPDKFYVFQRDDGSEVVVRNMGNKDKKIVYSEKGGTKVEKVQPNEIFRWALSLAQAEEVAKGVRSISHAYGGMIMDTEFCLDASDRLWFVQARPETRWNEDFEQHPDTIFMRRLEVDPKALVSAEVLLEGNGASRGAGQGTVKYLRSALELNKINKGDILAAARTDPDMVPGMRIAAGIMADVGGDTSHAAITSRELGIPAIIGIQRLEILRSLDGQEVTVDGSRGKVYRGLLPLREVGGTIDTSKLPATKTKVGLILADVGQSLFLSRLREVPDFEVGLLRAEFMLGNVGVHPLALEAYDNGALDKLIQDKLDELDARLTAVMRSQLDSGLISLNIKLREYVGALTGLADEMDALASGENARGTEEVLAMHRRLRELDKKLDNYLMHGAESLYILKTSVKIEEHVKAVLGLQHGVEENADSRFIYRRSESSDEISEMLEQAVKNPIVIELNEKIKALREEVARKMGLKSEMDEVRTLRKRIFELLQSRGLRSGKENYIQTLSQGLALFSMAFYGKDIIYRTTDFKTNEYHNLLGGLLFENHEDNPMLGYRGVSRDVHDWELEAFKLARGVFGGKNLHLMLPFVRTIEEARSMKRYLAQVHHLESGKDDLKLILMAEIPSNAILSKEFIKEVDGFSIGSNDMTQLVLGTDRDNSRLQHIYDEEDPAVVWAILSTIFTGQKFSKKIGFCGQGVSNSVILRGVVCIAGIVSASVVPDTYLQTKLDMAAVEAENIKVSELGKWINARHFERLAKLMEGNGYGHIIKKYKTPEDLEDWYEGEIRRLNEQLRDNIDTPKEDFYRQEMNAFRGTFHKPVIYSAWNWSQTVEDAMHHAGFATFEEQEAALKKQYSKKW